MNNTKVIRKGTPYPYPIRGVECPPDSVLERIDPWLILEFFRVEALLRSPTVQQLYRMHMSSLSSDPSLSTEGNLLLFSRYGISWANINSVDHHFLLNPHPVQSLTQAGITDMGAIIKDGQSEFWNLTMKSDTPQYVYLAINAAFPPETILKALKPVLKERNKLVWDPEGIWKPVTEVVTSLRGPRGDAQYLVPYGPRKKNSPILNIKAWLKYFRCYDLRYTANR